MNNGRTPHKAVFLDRDGTIAHDVNHTKRVEDFQLLPRVADAIRLLNQENYLVVIATNQSGIARGFFTEDTLQAIHNRMQRELEQSGARIDGVYYCPHHPEDRCSCRKPLPGLLKKASSELKIGLDRSFFIGDRGSDVQAAHAAGCKAILVSTGPTVAHPPEPPDHYAKDVYEAACWIVGQR